MWYFLGEFEDREERLVLAIVSLIARSAALGSHREADEWSQIN